MALRQYRNPLRDPRDRRLPLVAGPCALVIFGVTGDLSRKKLMPAVYDLPTAGCCRRASHWWGSPAATGAARTSRKVVHDAVREHARTPFREEVWEQLSEGIRFVAGRLRRRRGLRPPGGDHRRARPGPRHRRQPRVLPRRSRPTLFPGGREQLKRSGLAAAPEGSWRRSSSRSRSGTTWRRARELNAAGRSGVRTRRRSSASTTTSARRRSRTSSRCGSRTPCSSRSGTATTSTTSRSRWPRTSASAAGPATTTASARRAT